MISTRSDTAEIDRLIHDRFVSIIGKAQGFVRDYWLDTGAGEGASLGFFKDKGGADESVRLAADFVRTKMAALLSRSLRSTVGYRRVPSADEAPRLAE